MADEPTKRTTNTDIWIEVTGIKGDIRAMSEKLDRYISEACKGADDREGRLRKLEEFKAQVYWLVGIPTAITGIIITLILKGVIGG